MIAAETLERGRGRRAAVAAPLLGVLTVIAVIGAGLINPGPARAGSTYWVDVCAEGNEVGSLAPVTSGGSANVAMTADCGAGSSNTLSVGVSNGGMVGTGTSATYAGQSAPAQATWVLSAPAGEQFVGMSDTAASYDNLSRQTGAGPGRAWGQGFAWLSGTSWTAGPDNGQAFADCINGGTSCGTAGTASSTGPQTGTFKGVTAEAWGASCGWVPASTTDCNRDGSTATLTDWELEIDDPDTMPLITAAGGSSLAADEGRWMTGSAVNGATASFSFSDPGGVCTESGDLSAQWAQDGTSVGEAVDSASQTDAAFDSADGDFNQTTCTGPAASTYTPATTGLPTGAYVVEAAAANPSEYAAGTVATVGDGTLYIDDNTPSVTLSGASPGTWYPGPRTVTVSATDGAEAPGQNSGVKSTSCTGAGNEIFDNGGESAQDGYSATQVASVTVAGRGTNTLSCTTTNGVGTTSAGQTLRILIDEQKPTVRMSKLTAAPRLLRRPPTFSASGTEKQKLSGVTTTCSAHNLTTGDRLRSRRAAKVRLRLTSGGRWTVTCTARTGAGRVASHTERVDLERQPLPRPLTLSWRLLGRFTYLRAFTFPRLPAGTRFSVVIRDGANTVRHTARTRPAIRALVAWMKRHTYRAGDTVTIRLTRRGYLSLAGVITIHRAPRYPTLGS